MTSKNNAKFAFWYMLSLVALIFMALSTGQVIFQIINKTIADFTNGFAYSFDSGVLKFAISSLIISIPLYYLMVRQIETSLEKKELDRESAIRRWLTYFILFVSAVVMIIWLMMTINSFLGGELTSKFLLKSLTVIVICGLVFTYYLYDIRTEEKKNKNIVWAYLIVSLVLTVGSLVGAFFVVESPTEARNRRHDLEVLSQFSQIDATLNSYFIENKKLPTGLDQLKDQVPYLNAAALKDPISGQPYMYKRNSDTEYELCASFKTDNTKPGDIQDYSYADRWPHVSGDQCLKQKIAPIGNDATMKNLQMINQ
jgi:uncharacterized membrane protein